jgi:hypothetical protein
MRALLESWRAAQCPNYALQLSGVKRLQEVFMSPSVLERFLAPLEGVKAVRDS